MTLRGLMSWCGSRIGKTSGKVSKGEKASEGSEEPPSIYTRLSRGSIEGNALSVLRENAEEAAQSELFVILSKFDGRELVDAVAILRPHLTSGVQLRYLEELIWCSSLWLYTPEEEVRDLRRAALKVVLA